MTRLRRRGGRTGFSSSIHSAKMQKAPDGAFLILAERAGFEPAVRYKRTLAFQASALSRSATSPNFLLFALAARSNSWRAFYASRAFRPWRSFRPRNWNFAKIVQRIQSFRDNNPLAVLQRLIRLCLVAIVPQVILAATTKTQQYTEPRGCNERCSDHAFFSRVTPACRMAARISS